MRFRRDLAHLSDEALVALVARSDESALAELYDRIGGTAYGLAYRVLRDEALAEDAVQEAFLGLWRSAGSLHPRAGEGHDLDPDARAPARGRSRAAGAAAARRSRSKERPSPPRARRRRRPGSGSTASACRPRSRQLPDQQREAIELAYYGGYSQSELAERLGQPLGTIKSRMFSGLARLRELLDEGVETSWTYTS